MQDFGLFYFYIFNFFFNGLILLIFFSIICNYVSKIIPALQSRCTRFRFSPLKPDQITNRIKEIIEKENVDITQDGLDAVLKLGSGDMRKVLNILQSASLANLGRGVNVPVDANAVYSCTGKATPSDQAKILKTLLDDNFKTGYETIKQIQIDKGIALDDIITDLHSKVIDFDIPGNLKMFLLKELSDLEYRLSTSVNPQIQLASLIAIFTRYRTMVQIGLSKS